LLLRSLFGDADVVLLVDLYCNTFLVFEVRAKMYQNQWYITVLSMYCKDSLKLMNWMFVVYTQFNYQL